MQEHVGRLPVAYYDANKTGALVSRIMSDVEGVRNLIGTGLVEFVGGILTAVFSLVLLLRISPLHDRHRASLFIAAFGLSSAHRLRAHPAHLPRARQDQRRSHRPAHRIARRRARGQGLPCRSPRGATCSPAAWSACSDNVIRSLTAISLMSLSATTLLGLVGGYRHVSWAPGRFWPAHLTLGDFMSFTAFLAFLVAPMFQVVGIGTQITEALAGLDRTQEVLREKPEDDDPRRTDAIGYDPRLT